MNKPTISSSVTSRIKINGSGSVFYKHAGKIHTGGSSSRKKSRHKRVFFKNTLKSVPKQFKRVIKVL